jgi:hypothetical protein
LPPDKDVKGSLSDRRSTNESRSEQRLKMLTSKSKPVEKDKEEKTQDKEEKKKPKRTVRQLTVNARTRYVSPAPSSITLICWSLSRGNPVVLPISLPV